MRPVLFEIAGSIRIYGYGLCMAVGMILCVMHACHRAGKKYSLNPDTYFNGAIIGIIAGLLGAKILFWIVEIKEIIADPHFMLETLTGGFVVYGGLITGILAPVIYFKGIKKTTILDKLDIAVAGIAMAQGFGRIGCFLAGCCYGKEIPADAWYSFIGVVFPASAYCEAPTGIALFPTQLMSSIGDFLLFFFLWWYGHKERFAGETTCLYVFLYAIGRFLVEFLRGDTVRGFVGELSTSQFIAVIMFAVSIILWFVFKKMNGAPLRITGPFKEKEDTEKE